MIGVARGLDEDEFVGHCRPRQERARGVSALEREQPLAPLVPLEPRDVTRMRTREHDAIGDGERLACDAAVDFAGTG